MRFISFILLFVSLYGNCQVSRIPSDGLRQLPPDATSPIFVADYYISPTGDDVAGDGSFANPWFSLNQVWTVLAAGDRVYCRGGTYGFTAQQNLSGVDGTLGNEIEIFGYPGETPNFSKSGLLGLGYPSALVYFTGDYFHWKDLEFSDFTQENTNVWNPFRAYDVNNCTFETFDIHDNGGGFLLEENSNNNLVLNIDSYRNYDPLSSSPYNNADGIQLLKIDSGNANIVRGCRSMYNSDDGYDTWQNDGHPKFESCWSWMNGYQEDSTSVGSGDGSGFKLGSVVLLDSSVYGRTMQNCVAVLNHFAGFNDNTADCKMYFYNNVSAFNARGFRFYDTDPAHVIKNNAWYGNPTYDHGSALPNAVIDSNSYDATLPDLTGPITNDADFLSRDSTLLHSARQSDGSLPSIIYLHLAPGSDLIDRGIDVGLPFQGPRPDLGAFERESVNWILFLFVLFIRRKKLRL